MHQVLNFQTLQVVRLYKHLVCLLIWLAPSPNMKPATARPPLQNFWGNQPYRKTTIVIINLEVVTFPEMLIP